MRDPALHHNGQRWWGCTNAGVVSLGWNARSLCRNRLVLVCRLSRLRLGEQPVQHAAPAPLVAADPPRETLLALPLEADY